MSDITVWKKENTQIKERHKRNGKKESSGCGAFVLLCLLVGLFAVVPSLFIYYMFPDNEDAVYLGMFCMTALVIGTCLFFVRANMSDFIVFIKEEGVLYRIMFTNSEAGASLYGRLDNDLVGREEAIKKAKKASGIASVRLNSSDQLCKVMEVKRIREYRRSYRIRCVLIRVEKNRGKYIEKNTKVKTLRVIKNYENMDSLIEEFKALKQQITIPDRGIN